MYTPPPVILPPASRFAGMVAEPARRSIRLAEPQSSPIPPSATEVVVDYFYHAGEYWRARVPLDGVATVLGQAFNFSPLLQRKGPTGPEVVRDERGYPRRRIRWLNHVQARFQLAADAPMRLYPLGGDLDQQPVIEIHDFIYSIEAAGPPGVLFNLWDAMAGNMLSAHRFLSTEEMVFERIAVESQYVFESAPLKLSADQRRELLVMGLERSNRAGDTEPYIMYRPCVTNNCVSNPLRMLDKVVKYRGFHRLGALLYRLPLNPRLYLRLRGLDGDPRHHKLLRDEFASFLQDPATQARKREYVRAGIKRRREGRTQTPQG